MKQLTEIHTIRIMKTAEDKAFDYANDIFVTLRDNGSTTFNLDEIFEFAKQDYITGYNEAQKWIDVRELQEKKDVILKTSCGRIFRGYRYDFDFWEFDGYEVEENVETSYKKVWGEEVSFWRPIND